MWQRSSSNSDRGKVAADKATSPSWSGVFVESKFLFPRRARPGSSGYHRGAGTPEIRIAGYDLVTVRGKAKKPVCVCISDEEVKIEDASDLWGKDVVETEEALKDRFGEKASIASIGPAGENLISHACVCHQIYRQAGMNTDARHGGLRPKRGLTAQFHPKTALPD